MEAALKAIAAPHRRQILSLVRDGELSAGEIAEHFDVTPPAVSPHLNVLKEAGVGGGGTQRHPAPLPRAAGGPRAGQAVPRGVLGSPARGAEARSRTRGEGERCPQPVRAPQSS